MMVDELVTLVAMVLIPCLLYTSHFTFKDRCLRLNEGDTQLTLKQLSPVRLVKNDFFKQVEEAESRGATTDELRTLLRCV